MRRRDLFHTLLLFIFAVMFVYGMIELLVLRFEKGDAYPAYSTYRTDPMGAKAFYEGLSLLSGVDAERNLEPLDRVPGLTGATIFLFGLDRFAFSAMPQPQARALEDAALGGARVVISFAPTDDTPHPSSSVTKEERPNETPRKDAKGEGEEEREREVPGGTRIDLGARWSAGAQLSLDPDPEARLAAAKNNLPASLAWHTTLVFTPGDGVWRTIYARGGKPVLIERAYGKGSIVLSSDSFFLSNEAMKIDRHPYLLSWLCGAGQKIVFDETHLGVSRSHGIATLLRRHGLTAFFGSLILLAMLVIWRQSTLFIPISGEAKAKFSGPAEACFTGLTSLLRSNIPPDDLLTTCLEEWKQSFMHGEQNLSSLLPRMAEIVAADQAQGKKARNPVRAYRNISALIEPRAINRRRGNQPV